MTIEDQIRDEKLQYDINREAAKISALSSGKIDKYEYLTGGEILPSNYQQIKLNLLILHWDKLLKNKQKQLKIKEKKKIEAIQDNKKQRANTQELTIKNIIPEDILSDESKKRRIKLYK